MNQSVLRSWQIKDFSPGEGLSAMATKGGGGEWIAERGVPRLAVEAFGNGGRGVSSFKGDEMGRRCLPWGLGEGDGAEVVAGEVGLLGIAMGIGMGRRVVGERM